MKRKSTIQQEKQLINKLLKVLFIENNNNNNNTVVSSIDIEVNKTVFILIIFFRKDILKVKNTNKSI